MFREPLRSVAWVSGARGALCLIFTVLTEIGCAMRDGDRIIRWRYVQNPRGDFIKIIITTRLEGFQELTPFP